MKEYEFEITLKKITVYGVGEDGEDALRKAKDWFYQYYLTEDIDFTKVVVKSVKEYE